MRSALIAALLIVATTPSGYAGEKVQIPLSDVWGLNLPSTQDIEGIDLPGPPLRENPGWGFVEFKRLREQTIERLRQALADKPPAAEALPGFVVAVGEKQLFAVLRNQVIPALEREDYPVRRNTIQSDQDTYLVFYSHPSSYYVRLNSVSRQGNTIDVSYTFEPHYTIESSVHLALIPLGKLEAGEYQVRYSQETMDRKYIDAGFIRVTDHQARRFVCQPFSFTVYDPPAPVTDEDPVSERIPLDRIWALKMPGTKDVRELSSSDTAKIHRTLIRGIDEEAKAGPCFFVIGEGEESLQNAARIIVDGATPVTTLPADKALSLVFYAYPAPGYVVLHSVRHTDNHVTIRYRVIRHQSANVTAHFAVIPLGKLATGQLTVETIEVASETPYTDHALTDRAVCDSCTVTVEEGAGQ